jgi:chromosome segregation ATPase
LKQFKKESSKQNKTDHFISNNNSNNNHHHYNQENKTDNSGRSSPASTHSSLNSNSFNNKTSGSSTFINSQSTNAPLDYKDQQLQLHVQTIGILVAEKAELHSKLQQTLKKCDKKQEECDELSGRLKVSRQKITDLERLVQQLNQSITSEASISSDQQATNSVEDSNQTLIVDELRMKLNETNDKLVYKQQDLNQMNQLNSELASQLEILTIKLTQFTNSDPETIRAELDESEKRAAGLLAKNQTLQATINDYEFKLKQQHDQLKQEYQQYVDQLKHQIEGLVDQINRLTDEREASFSKIDSLEDMLNKLRKKNESLEANLTEQAAKLKENDQATNSKQTNKEQLLENEIKYFKQQIEILVSEHNNLIGLLDEKERLIGSLERQIQTHEQNKEQHAKLLEQTHNDKQTLSRAIQQNKELKDQLAELQDAFVSVTKQNLDLATQMESFKFSQIKVNNLVPQGEELNVKLAETTEWDDDSDGFRSAEAVESAPSQDNALQQVSLMSGIKDRLNELEKENKDLNDYITLMDENIKKNNDQQFSTINAQLKQIELMNQTIAEINVEKSDLKKQLEVLLLKKTDNNNNQNQNSDSNSGLTKTLEFNEANFKNLLLLEVSLFIQFI